MKETYLVLLRTTRLGKMLSQAYDKALREKGLTFAQWEIILILVDQETLNQNRLAKLLGVNKASLVPLLNRMERDGWIKRTIGEEKLSSYAVTLTNKTKNKVAEITKLLRHITDDVTQGINSKDLDMFSSQLDKILENIKRITL